MSYLCEKDRGLLRCVTNVAATRNIGCVTTNDRVFNGEATTVVAPLLNSVASVWKVSIVFFQLMFSVDVREGLLVFRTTMSAFQAVLQALF